MEHKHVIDRLKDTSNLTIMTLFKNRY